jgi:ceramide glucosyltransferase
MIHQATRVIEIASLLGTLSSLGYYVLCLWSTANFLRQRKAADQSVRAVRDLPPVSILKPLKGTDPEMYESLRSHCLQDYPQYEIIFGVSDPKDPSTALVNRLKTEFQESAIRLMVCPQRLGANAKVSCLAQMLTGARYDHLIVNDSDIRVAPDYLRRVLAALSDPQTGLVTCLYRGVANSSLGSRLESLGISTDFCAGILAAQQLEGGIRFGLGSTLALRRRDLQAIGGFEAFVDYLADDYQIGSRVASLGLKVKLSDVVVETFLPRYTLRGFFQHQLRWARTIRDSRFGGYVGLGLTFGIPWAILALFLSHGAAWAWALLLAVAAMRTAVATVVGIWVLGDPHVPRLLALIPVRDVLALLVWLVSFAGHTVSWRGESFKLHHGKLGRITTP